MGAIQGSTFLQTYDLGSNGPGLQEVRRAFEFLDESQWWRQEQMREWQLTKLAPLVAHAARRVPFYRALYGDRASVESWDDFRSLPIVTRAQFADTDPREREASFALPEHKVLHTTYTSGTSGRRLQISITQRLQLWRYACILREWDWLALDPRGDCAILRAPISPGSDSWNESLGAEVYPTWQGPALGALVGFGKGFNFDIGRPIERIAEALDEIKPAFLHGTPTYLQVLADHLRHCRPLALLTLSEQLFPQVREELEQRYGARVFDTYAAVEVNRAAADCPSGQGYHLHEENVFVELLDESNSGAPPGVPARVVVTSLHNYATPVIRYELGDLAEYAEGACPCGRGLRRISTFHGRQISRFLLENGRVCIATPIVIALQDTPDVRAAQIRQKSYDDFEILVMGRTDFTAEETGDLQRRFDTLLQRPARLTYQFVERIPPLPNGKTPRVVIDFTP
ncbi:MAG: phenylacetate--CoA ligase family protein [Armatimonadetes bacterium]|nr:phenylacetate--CoA ligase family protein [Armatimonadota bacterium]NOG92854.1 phenylacetate--CoA ligase family protein [Armatimonadota bacterium]